MRPRLRRAALVVLLVTWAAPAHADTAAELAEQKARANQAMIELRTDEALSLYRHVYDQTKEPSLLYNMARAEQALGRHADALSHLEAFDRDAPADVKAHVPKLAELLAEERAKVATLAVTADVPGARVLVDGKDVGPVPLELRLNAGRATVDVTAPGRLTHKRSVTLPGGGTMSIDATLFPAETNGFLTVTSKVAGAEVVIDGKRLGQVPVDTVLSAGEHRVVVRRDGHHPSDTRVRVVAGETREVSIDLAKQTPVTKTWWFWTGIGVAVATGVGVTAALLTERSAEKGDIGNGRIAAPLVRFK